ncbi:MAG: protein kinase domain-containing protein, partial [Myxococcota bacterium]
SVAGLGSGEKARTQRRQRFIREVQALTQVSHENVVHVYDAGEADDPDLGWLLFYSMQYVEGITLAQLVQRQGALDPGAAAAVCAQVAYGLGAGHARGIVHRDVKPANIFLSQAGRALIGDFGIAKIEGSTQITRRDQLVGTPNYLAPEQILGDPVTAATDVFALGALFYIIVSNRPLRTQVDAAGLLASARGNAAKEKLLLERGIPAGLRAIVAKALEADPGARFIDGNAFGDARGDFATKVPSVEADDDYPEPAQGRESTPEDSSPFAPALGAGSSTGPRSDGHGSPFNPVEEAARALLDEVGHGSPATAKKKPRPILEARTESTSMFNLRALEARAGKSGGQREATEPVLEPVVPPPDLPVARVESTVMFNLRRLEAQRAAEPVPASAQGRSSHAASHAPSPGTRAPVAVAQTSPTPVTPGFAGDGDTLDPHDDDDTEEGDTVHTTSSTASSVETGGGHHNVNDVRPRTRSAAAPNRYDEVTSPPTSTVIPARRRRQLVLASLIGASSGLVAGLMLRVFSGGDPGVLPKPVQDAAVTAETSPAVRKLPEHCGRAAPTKQQRGDATAKVDEATLLQRAGKDADARRALEEAVALDGRNALAHYELARLVVKLDADALAATRHYECVVNIEGDSEVGRKAAKAIAAANQP